jgi:membrane associated rhomboid family serine protease
LIIPWQVDVPQERRPFCNWLLIAGIIAGFVFQTISIWEHKAKLPEKIKEFETRSLEDTAKELGVSGQQLKEIERSVDAKHERIEKFLSKKRIRSKPKNPKESEEFKEYRDKTVKKILIEKYYVWEQVTPFILDGFNIEGLFGHLWLHGGIIHLLGNLLFLWIFGNAVCAKIGNITFLLFYIMLGILAGIAHSVFQGGPCIGASGAIMGVVGMYLVFFPANDITCYFVFIFFFRPIIREFTLASFWMILFWLAFDIYGASMGSGGVAYFAHLGGFAMGFLLALLMLKTKWITMESYEESLFQVFQKIGKPVEALPGTNYSNRVLQNELITQRITDQEEDSKTAEPEKTPSELEVSWENLIHFTCACGKKVRIPSKYAGKKAKCPKCKNRIKIPEK